MSPTRLPGVGFVFIHGRDDLGQGIGRLQVIRPTGTEVDSEGRTREVAADPVDVRGYLTIQTRDEQVIGAAGGPRGVRIDAALALPRRVVIDETCTVLASGIDPYLDGVYAIGALHPTVVHVRALLTRLQYPDGTPVQRAPGT